MFLLLLCDHEDETRNSLWTLWWTGLVRRRCRSPWRGTSRSFVVRKLCTVAQFPALKANLANSSSISLCALLKPIDAEYVHQQAILDPCLFVELWILNYRIPCHPLVPFIVSYHLAHHHACSIQTYTL
jgi:hypothetical protein